MSDKKMNYDLEILKKLEKDDILLIRSNNINREEAREISSSIRTLGIVNPVVFIPSETKLESVNKEELKRILDSIES